MEGTNGYAIFVLASQPRAGRPGSVLIVAKKGPVGATYSAPATVTETSITADLGTLGGISVSFQPNGQLSTKSTKCARQKVEVVEGSYEGTIAFHGEEAYTAAEATSVPANIRPLLALLCGATVVTGGSKSPRGAELLVRNPALGPRFNVVKSSPSGSAHFRIEVSEYNAGISIQRFAGLLMPAASFRYSADLQTATVRPPSPFSGVAHFDRRKKANRRWSGGLVVDMPGLPNVPLTGRQLRAGLT